jgi:putative membrane protein
VDLAVFPAVAGDSAAAAHQEGGRMRESKNQLLNPNEIQQVESAVAEAEKKTSGEIVCMVVPKSYHYPMSNVIGATSIALPLALILTPLTGAWMWIDPHNMWLFLGIFTLLFIVSFLAVRNIAPLKRLFISRREMDEEVEEATLTSFFLRGLYQTRERNGILLFISAFEHKVWILADKGINDKVPQGHWDDIVAELINGIRRKQAASAICNAVEAIGEDLKHHFPIQADDTNELSNVIIGEQGEKP